MLKTTANKITMLRVILVPDLLPANEEMEELAETVLESLDEVVKYFDS